MKSSNAISNVRRLMINKKVGTFLICLCIASFLWVVHALNINYSHNITIPVKFLNLPTNKVIIGELPEKLNIEIKASGLKLLLISLKEKFSEVVIDFNMLKNNEKSQSYSINNSYLNLHNSINYNVEILKVRPDTLFFSDTKGISKLLPVKANLNVNFEQGYSMVSKPTIIPAFVNVSGDSASVSKMDTVYTYYLNLKNVKENFSSPLLLKKPFTSINYNVKDVQLSFTVDKLIESLVKIPIEVMNNHHKEKIKLLPKQIDVTYLVAMKDYENINENSFKAIVNYEDIKANNKNLKVEIISSPSEVKIIRISPETVSYLIYK